MRVDTRLAGRVQVARVQPPKPNLGFRVLGFRVLGLSLGFRAYLFRAAVYEACCKKGLPVAKKRAYLGNLLTYSFMGSTYELRVMAAKLQVKRVTGRASGLGNTLSLKLPFASTEDSGDRLDLPPDSGQG